MKKLLTVILFFAAGQVFSQSPEWQQCFSLQAGASRAFDGFCLWADCGLR